MKKLIIANWKMNPGSQQEAKNLFDAVKEGISANDNVEVVICPPFTCLSGLKFQNSAVKLGAQNMSYKETGAFTGQISSVMLKDLEVSHVLLGHSEVRKYLHETNQDINKKLKEAFNAGLKPVLCMGDEEGQNKAEILKTQLTEGLHNVSKEDVVKMIVAYEPIWAIGTGNNCSPEETKSAVAVIKNTITDLYDADTANVMQVLYGGSVNSQNSVSYLKEAGVDGLLVGGASLKPEEFIAIVTSAQ